MLFETVDQALGTVQARRSGEATFRTAELAEKFSAAVLDKFNPWGYGSYADVSGTTVKWSVGSAD